MNALRETFKAEIKKHEGINGAYVEIPFDVEKILGAKRVKVKATFDGTEYRGSIVRMSDCYLIGMTQALRREIKKSPGDIVTVQVEKDEDERTVELPPVLEQALQQAPTAKENFDKLSYTHQKEYVQWINDAKKDETKKSRIEKTILMLQENKKLK